MSSKRNTYSSLNTETGELKVEKKGIDIDNYTLPTIVFYGLNEKDDQDYSENNSNQIKVNIIQKDENIGKAIYVPLIKLVDFSANIGYTWNLDIQENNASLSIEGWGSIDVRGNKNIYGIYSVKSATQSITQIIHSEVKKTIVNSIEQTVRNKLEEQILEDEIRV